MQFEVHSHEFSGRVRKVVIAPETFNDEVFLGYLMKALEHPKSFITISLDGVQAKAFNFYDGDEYDNQDQIGGDDSGSQQDS